MGRKPRAVSFSRELARRRSAPRGSNRRRSAANLLRYFRRRRPKSVGLYVSRVSKDLAKQR